MTTSLAQSSLRPADPLAFLTQAKSLLARAESIDEVKKIRDKAEALRQYVRAQGESFEVQQYAAELKLRAERRAGELLASMEKAKNQNSAGCTLQQAGIERTQSHRWQRIASVPEEAFESFLSDTVAAGDELTTAAALRLARETRDPVPREELSDIEVGNLIRRAIWSVYERCPVKLRPMVAPKFRDFADELQRTGDLSW